MADKNTKLKIIKAQGRREIENISIIRKNDILDLLSLMKMNTITIEKNRLFQKKKKKLKKAVAKQLGSDPRNSIKVKKEQSKIAQFCNNIKTPIRKKTSTFPKKLKKIQTASIKSKQQKISKTKKIKNFSKLKYEGHGSAALTDRSKKSSKAPFPFQRKAASPIKYIKSRSPFKQVSKRSTQQNPISARYKTNNNRNDFQKIQYTPFGRHITRKTSPRASNRNSPKISSRRGSKARMGGGYNRIDLMRNRIVKSHRMNRNMAGVRRREEGSINRTAGSIEYVRYL